MKLPTDARRDRKLQGWGRPVPAARLLTRMVGRLPNASDRLLWAGPRLAQALLLLLEVDARLRMAGFRQTQQSAGGRPGIEASDFLQAQRSVGGGPGTKAPDPGRRALPSAEILEEARQMAWALRLVGRYLPRARCLHRALALLLWLDRRGIVGELRMGVRPTRASGEGGAGETVEGHAWVEWRGVPLDEDRSVCETFALLVPAGQPDTVDAPLTCEAGGAEGVPSHDRSPRPAPHDSNPDPYQRLAYWLVGSALSGTAPENAEWMEFVTLAQDEGVAPLLHRALEAVPGTELPPAAGQVLESVYREAVYASMLHESVRARVCRRLTERGIPVLLLKGGALAFTCYDDPATRPMMDLDVLIPHSRVQEAAVILEEDGFCLHQLARSLLPAMNRPHIHLIYVHGENREVVELHWELQALRKVQAEALCEIWAHARPAPFPLGEGVRVMDAGHLIPLLCAHMTLQHKRARLIWLYDLHRVLQSAGPAEAARVIDAATRWGLVSCTALAVRRVEELFGTPVPEPLASWASASAGRNDLQARVAAAALAPGTVEMPDNGPVNLFMNGDWRFLRSLLPAPAVVRERFGLAAHESVLPAYLTLMGRRLRQGPTHLRQLWRLRRSAARPRRLNQPPAPRQGRP